MKLNPHKNDNLTNQENPSEVPNEVQILINDNSDTYNHNISVRITDGKCEINPEELSKIAMNFYESAIKKGYGELLVSELIEKDY